MTPMRLRPALALLSLTALAAIPAGFQSLFNGRDLSGWHISELNHHGNTKGWSVKDGVVMVTQDKPGNGGILLTDRKFRDFEISLDIKPDFGCDGGLFLRSSEKGEAYQVMLDYLEGGTVGGIYGERLQGVGAGAKGDKSGKGWQQHWRKDDWNHLRARIEGAVPHIQVWMNGVQIVDWTDDANHLPDGATAGMIALQAHRSDPTKPNSRWKEGGFHRYRNVAIKELR